MAVTVWNNNPYFLQFLKNSGRIFVNATRKNLTHRGGTTFGMLIVMLRVIPQLITVYALVYTAIAFKIYNDTKMIFVNVQSHCLLVELAAPLDQFGNLTIKLICNEIQFKKNPLSAENQKVERLQNLQAPRQNEYNIYKTNFWQSSHICEGLHLGALPNNKKSTNCR